MSLCDDVIKYRIIPFVYRSDDFQILYRVPNKKFRKMIIEELQQRKFGEILIRDREQNLMQHLNFANYLCFYPTRYTMRIYYYIHFLVLYNTRPKISVKIEKYGEKTTIIKFSESEYQKIPFDGQNQRNEFDPHGFQQTIHFTFTERYVDDNHRVSYKYWPIGGYRDGTFRMKETHQFYYSKNFNKKQHFHLIISRIRKVFGWRNVIFKYNYYKNRRFTGINYSRNIPHDFVQFIHDFCYE